MPDAVAKSSRQGALRLFGEVNPDVNAFFSGRRE
jgi:hypothetical protein